MSSISLAMIVKNEQKYIQRCLQSVKPMVSEMIVVDTGSTDDTREIALSCGAIVVDFPWIDDFSAARNFAIEHATSDWILCMDADEFFERDYSNELKEFLRTNDNSIGRITIKSEFTEGNDIQVVKANISRIFPRHLRFTGRIHEQLASTLPRVDTKLKVNHDGYFNTNKSDRNLRLLLLELNSKPQEPYLLFQLGKEYKRIGELAKAEHFFTEGYQLLNTTSPRYIQEAIVDYLYILLDNQNYEKAIDVITETQQSLHLLADFHFVCGLIYTNLAIALPTEAASLIPLIEQSYVSCLRLGEDGVDDIITGTSTFLAAYNLALFYETVGQEKKAQSFYQYASSMGYKPASNRISMESIL